MRKPFLAFLVVYLGLFLFFQEEIHGLSHHLREVNHTHSLKCFFEGGEEKKPGLGEICHFHDLYTKESNPEVNFYSLKSPKLLNFSFFKRDKKVNSENFIFFLPLSRAPPKIS